MGVWDGGSAGGLVGMGTRELVVAPMMCLLHVKFGSTVDVQMGCTGHIARDLFLEHGSHCEIGCVNQIVRMYRSGVRITVRGDWVH